MQDEQGGAGARPGAPAAAPGALEGDLAAGGGDEALHAVVDAQLEAREGAVVESAMFGSAVVLWMKIAENIYFTEDFVFQVEDLWKILYFWC